MRQAVFTGIAQMVGQPVAAGLLAHSLGLSWETFFGLWVALWVLTPPAG